MDELLQSEEWRRWDESLQRVWYEDSDMEAYILSAKTFQCR